MDMYSETAKLISDESTTLWYCIFEFYHQIKAIGIHRSFITDGRT